MLKTFIEKPVLSTVISIIIVILGLIGLVALPISQYPDIAPPQIQVTTTYTGANADVVLNSVIVPIEEAINGVDGMDYISSTATNTGQATINVIFKQGTDPNMAAVNVQNRVSKAQSSLPQEVINYGVTTQKKQNNMLVIFSLYSDDDTFDETFIQNYIKINILPKIQRINGVGDASVFGSRDYSMRIWLDPQAMNAHALMPSDISTALKEQNLEAAPGKLGESANGVFEYVLKYGGTFKKPENYGDVIVKTESDGKYLRLRDVAKIELGALDYSMRSTVDGKTGATVAIYQSAGSNARNVVLETKQILAEMSESFPGGLKYAILLDANEFLDASIESVIHTLLEAFILVFIVVFIFLQDFRSTLIPAIAVPVSIVGTFFFLNVIGFTINLLTLFALVLAIGIVVDDAIVVVEAVHSKFDTGIKSSKRATKAAMSEITGAILSITLIMAAVFIPVTFMPGSAGVFYKQFGLTLAIAIAISALNALTLSPALCALLLKPHESNEHHKKNLLQKFYAAFNAGFEAVTSKYKSVITFFARKKALTLIFILAFSAALFYFLQTTQTAFVPQEDQGIIFADISLPPASSLARTEAITRKIDSIVATVPEVQMHSIIVGNGLISGVGNSYSMLIIKLKHWSQREGMEHNIKAVLAKLNMLVADIREANIIFFPQPIVPGFSMFDGFDLKLEDKTGGDLNEFSETANSFIGALMQRPELAYAMTSFNTNNPQYMIEIDVAKAKEAGVAVNSILQTLQGYYGGLYVNSFNRFGKQYKVMIKADPNARRDVASLHSIFVKNSKGEMAPIQSFVTLERVYGAENITRYNLLNSISITGSPKAAYSSGDAIKAVQEVAKESLSSDYTFEFSGLTKEEISSGNATMFIFALVIIFVYFLLCAQYESYILPFAVLLSVPIGLTGSLVFANLLKINNNIYLQIALVMLIGLLAKNAILIIEFAIQRRRNGLSIFESAIEGAVARLRPILMTSFAFILGLMPLALATGVGANGNRSIGIAAVGGMIFGTFIGTLVIPALFVIFQTLQEKVSGNKKEEIEIIANNDE